MPTKYRAETDTRRLILPACFRRGTELYRRIGALLIRKEQPDIEKQIDRPCQHLEIL